MSTEFDSLQSASEWSAKLAELLAAARAAAERSDEERLAVAHRLTDFIARSYPANEEIRRLDEIASAAARALAEQVLTDAMGRIASRTAILETLTGELEAIRSRTLLVSLPSASQIADLASSLATIAEDAGALARLRAGKPQDTGEFHGRIGRLATTLGEIQAAFRSLASAPAEPGVRASGTVIPEGMRGRP